jgi:hypothetical protein
MERTPIIARQLMLAVPVGHTVALQVLLDASSAKVNVRPQEHQRTLEARSLLPGLPDCIAKVVQRVMLQVVDWFHARCGRQGPYYRRVSFSVSFGIFTGPRKKVLANRVHGDEPIECLKAPDMGPTSEFVGHEDRPDERWVV